MAITVARLMAEIGIDPRQFTTGLKGVKDSLIDTAKNFVILEQAAEKAGQTQIKANEAVIASNKNYQKTLADIKFAEDEVEKAQRRVESSTNRLATANEKAARARALANAAISPDDKKLYGTAATQAERSATNIGNSHKDSLLNLQRAQEDLAKARQKSVEVLEKETLALQAQQEAIALTAIQTEALAKAQILLAESSNAAMIAIERQNTILLQSITEEKLGSVFAAELNTINVERERNAIAAEKWAEQIAMADARALEADRAYWNGVIADGERATKAREAEAAQMSAHAIGVEKAWSSNLESVARKGREVGQQLSLSMSLPLAFVGVEAVKSATEFEFAIDKIRGQTNASKSDIDAWAEDIQKLGPEIGKLPKELADGMYFVASAGYQGKQALDILTESGKASEEGLGEVGKITHAVTSIMFDYKNEVHSAADAMDLLIAGTREGKLNIDQLAPALGRIMSLTASLGIPLHDVIAAVDSMTHAGLSVDRAATSIQTFISKLAVGGKQANAILKLAGTDTQKFLEGLQTDFLGTFIKVNGALEKHNQALIDLSANGRSSAGILSLIGENASYNAGIFERMNHVTGDSAKAWDAVKDSSKVALDQMKSILTEDLIRIGQDLAPTIINVSHAVAGMADSFANLDPSVRSFIVDLGIVGAAVGPLIYVFSQLALSVITIGKIGDALKALTALAPEIEAIEGASVAAETGVAGMGVAMAVTAPEVLIVVGAITALVLAGYALKKAWDALFPSQEAVENQWKDAAKIDLKNAEHAVEIAKLSKEYTDLQKIQSPNLETQEKIAKVAADLVKLDPNLYKGIDDRNHVLLEQNKLLLNQNELLQRNLELHMQQMKQAYLPVQKTAQTRADLNEEIQANKKRIESYKAIIAVYNDYQKTYQSMMAKNPSVRAEEVYGTFAATKAGKNLGSIGINDPSDFAGKFSRANTELPGLEIQTAKMAADVAALDKQFKDSQAAFSKLGKDWKNGIDSTHKTPKPPGPANIGKPGKFHPDQHLEDLGNQILQIGLENVDTAKIKDSCSVFVSKVAQQLGVAIPSIPVAKNLVDYWINELGGKVTKRFGQSGAPKPGDLVAWHGTQFGSVKDSDGQGWHVGMGLGGGQVLDNTGARRGKPRKMFDSTQAEYISLPEGTQLGDAVSKTQDALKDKAKDANELYNKQIQFITDLVVKHAELSQALETTAISTQADALARQYEIDKIKLQSGVLKDSILMYEQQNIALERMLELHNKIIDVEKKTNELNNTSWLTSQFPGDSNKKKRDAISDMGIQNYRDIISSGNQHGVTAANSFIDAKVKAIDVSDYEKAKNDLTEINSQLDNILNRDSGDKSEASKLFIKWQDSIRNITDSGSLDKLKTQYDELLKKATSADTIKARENFEKLMEPLSRGIAASKAAISGTSDQKNDQFRQWWDSNKDSLLQVLRNFGLGGMMGVIAQWQENTRLDKIAEGVKNYNDQLGQTKLLALELGAVDPYQKWLLSMSKLNENGKVTGPNFGGKNPEDIYNTTKANEANQALLSLQEQTTRTSAEISAKDPFNAWLVSLMQFNQKSKLIELPPGFDKNLLKIQFDLMQNQKFIQEFASGVKDIFGNMINDIRDRGFKGLFTSIALGFDQLLYKMAVEYLESKIYQLLLNSIGGAFTVGGSNGSFFNTNGTPINKSIAKTGQLTTLVSGFSAGARAGLSAGNTFNQYSGGTINSVSKSYVASGIMPQGSTVGDTNTSHTHLHFHSTFNVTSAEQAKQLEQHVYVQAQQRANRLQKRLG